MNKHSGSCLCGKITYKTDSELRPIIACHCTQCRKTSGHFVAATQVPTSKLYIDGEVTWHQSSKEARRGFCNTCGGNLFWQPGDRSYTSIFAGTLDGPTNLSIESQIHTDSKGDYYDLPPVPIADQQP
ncbi:MAG: GFA family protein [Alphaproteobacteria bacterium]|nr:GFA family protein [Alphaproteobacteria bacterium]